MPLATANACQQQRAKAEQQKQLDRDTDEDGGASATRVVLGHAEAGEQGNAIVCTRSRHGMIGTEAKEIAGCSPHDSAISSPTILPDSVGLARGSEVRRLANPTRGGPRERAVAYPYIE